jgi:hypothetical protein
MGPYYDKSSQLLDLLSAHFQRHPVAQLPDLCETLRCSGRTVFRALNTVGYHSSFSQRGRYYTLVNIPHFDPQGLWFHQDVGFSLDGTLGATVERLIREAAAGHTHHELEALLRVRCHNVLLELVEAQRIARERLDMLYVYLAGQPRIAKQQLARRREQLDKEHAAALAAAAARPLEAARVIEVLLAVIRDRDPNPKGVAAVLAGRGLGVSEAQVEEVFDRYGLEKKRARSRSRRLPS